MNPDGYPATLVESHPANMHAVRSGIWSRTGRVLQPRAEELVAELQDAPFLTHADRVGIEEIASLLALLEACDRELAEGVVRRGRDRVALVKVRLGASRRLEGWLAHYGMTPRSRSELASVLAAGESIYDGLRRRRESA
jgi:hypothetical protein